MSTPQILPLDQLIVERTPQGHFISVKGSPLGTGLHLEKDLDHIPSVKESLSKWAQSVKPVKVMKLGMGRDKGAGFELDVADKMSLWWFGVKRAIRRTPMSGGWSKTKAAADLISELDPFPFSVECKHNKSWTFLDLFNPTLGELGSFWTQCKKQRPPNTIALLVFRGNFGKTYVMFRDAEFPLLDLLEGPELLKRRLVRTHDQDGEEITITHFEDCLLKYNPEALIVTGTVTTLRNVEIWRQHRIEAAAKFPPKPVPTPPTT
jgi:hypothetical protein